MSKFSIGWMFPDTMFLHGERGNVLALARYAGQAGLDHEITRIDFDTDVFSPEEYDVLFMAAGEISRFPEVREWLLPYKDDIMDYIAEGHPLIVTGTTIGLFCNEVERDDGSAIKGLGILDAKLVERDHVYGDDIYYKCAYGGREFEVVGSQISMGDIITDSAEPLGDIVYGYGNNGKDGREGIRLVNSIFTNALGPVLVTNPWLTIQIILTAAKVSGKAIPAALAKTIVSSEDAAGSDPERELSIEDFDLSLEKKSFEAKKKYNLSKEVPAELKDSKA